jgi:3-deoxy-D-manno-octulosonic-acid transferase
MAFYRKALDTFTYFFVQNRDPKLLQQLEGTNVVSGDTRFDRVAAILDKDSRLYFAVQNDTNHCCGFLAKDEPFFIGHKHKP